ncbi:hypothetical protein C8J56DRAFT_1165267 [Mycena floridula]|nr:hypothetical protein C8J56DRAFT_1165267 [Mycena floridula]
MSVGGRFGHPSTTIRLNSVTLSVAQQPDTIIHGRCSPLNAPAVQRLLRFAREGTAFDVPEIQRQYVTRFLPPEFAASPSGELLVKRIWDWCRPRHRLTAVVAFLLRDAFRHPHGILNRFVQTFTHYTPTDADDFVMKERPADIKLGIEGIEMEWLEDDLFIRSTLHELIFHCLVTAEHPVHFNYEQVSLVTAGFGRFIDKDMSLIAIDQPTVLVAAAMWFTEPPESVTLPQRSITDHREFVTYFRQARPTRYYALASYMAHAFQNPRTLSSLFTFPISPATSELPAALASPPCNVHDEAVRASDLIPQSPALGYSAQSCDDVTAWLKQDHPAAFYICPPECNAELIFAVRTQDKLLWIILGPAGNALDEKQFDDSSESGSEDEEETNVTLTTADLNEADDCIRPQNLFPNADPTTKQRLVDAFRALPNGLSTRVRVAQRMSGSPVATLNTTLFETITASISGPDIVEGLISSIQGKRKRHYDPPPLPAEQPKPAKRAKNHNLLSLIAPEATS